MSILSFTVTATTAAVTAADKGYFEKMFFPNFLRNSKKKVIVRKKIIFDYPLTAPLGGFGGVNAEWKETRERWTKGTPPDISSLFLFEIEKKYEFFFIQKVGSG